MTNITVDTSVVTKWYAQKKEDDIDQAFELLSACQSGSIALICPNIILLELANVLYLGKKFSQPLCEESLRSFRNLCWQLVDVDETALVVKTMYDHQLASYDAAFVALAEERNMPLITADYAHHKKSVSPRIVWLREWK